MQRITGRLATECHDRCARFHILALHLQRDDPNFSSPLEEQQLMNSEWYWQIRNYVLLIGIGSPSKPQRILRRPEGQIPITH
jgi:hypothetical protein